MANRAAISRAALEFLLAVVESRRLTISAGAKEFSAEVTALKKFGVIRPEGHLPVVADDQDRPVELEWSEGGFGYFSETDGWVDVPDADIQSFSIDVGRLLASFTAKLGISGRSEPLVLVADHLWDLGMARFAGRPKRSPVLFARRLSDFGIFSLVSEALRRRPATGRRIILTSTSHALLPKETGQCEFISVVDVLDERDLTVDPDLVALRLDQAPTEIKSDVIIRADAKEVVFFGEIFRFPKGVKQRQVILYLYKRYKEGVLRVSSQEIAEECGLGDSTRVRDIFKKHRAWGTLLSEHNGMCGFAFDRVPKRIRT